MTSRAEVLTPTGTALATMTTRSLPSELVDAAPAIATRQKRNGRRSTKPWAGRSVDRARAMRLSKLEHAIFRSLRSPLEIGKHLRDIRNEGLYAERGHKTFERYGRERFGFSRSHTYRLIDYAEMQDALSPFGDMLPSEGVARALLPLKGDPEKIHDILTHARKATGTKRALTARDVRAEAVRLLGPRALDVSNAQGTTQPVEPTPRHTLVSELRDLWGRTIEANIITFGVIDELIDLLNQLRNRAAG